MSGNKTNLLASASSHHTQFSAQSVENPLKTMKPESDAISQQSISVALANQASLEPSSSAAPKDEAPPSLNFQPVSKYTRQLMEQ